MNQSTPVNSELPTSQSVVIATEMKARREALRRLLTASSGSNDTFSEAMLDRRQHLRNVATTNLDPARNSSAGGQNRQQSQPSQAVPSAVTSVLSVIGEGLVQGWWHGHPARAVAQVASSLLHDQARQHPLRLIAASAVLGSAVVILKPWRRFNVGKLLLSAVAGSSTGVVAKLLGVAGSDDAKSRRRHK